MINHLSIDTNTVFGSGATNTNTPATTGNQPFGQQQNQAVPFSSFGKANTNENDRLTSSSSSSSPFTFNNVSTGDSSSHTNPFSGFQFGQPSAPVTAAKPPIFGGFGTSSVSTSSKLIIY